MCRSQRINKAKKYVGLFSPECGVVGLPETGAPNSLECHMWSLRTS